MSKSIPLADIFDRFEKAITPTAAPIEIPNVAVKHEGKSFYRGQWDALSDLSNYEDTVDVETPWVYDRISSSYR